MKKIISLFLALLMLFSVATVAFAADEGTETPSGTEVVEPQDEGAEGSETPTEPAKEETSAADLLETIKDMPVGEAKALLKVGKVILKLVKVFVKLGIKFGLIDTDDLVKQVAEMFGLDPETELPAGASEAIRVLI